MLPRDVQYCMQFFFYHEALFGICTTWELCILCIKIFKSLVKEVIKDINISVNCLILINYVHIFVYLMIFVFHKHIKQLYC